MSPDYSIPYITWNYVLLIHTKFTIQLASVGLPQTYIMQLTIISPVVTIGLGIMKDFIRNKCIWHMN